MENTRGSLFMVLAMAAFAMEDMFVKSAAQSLPIGFVLALFGLGGMITFIWLVKRQGDSIFHPAMTSKPILLRACCEVIARVAFSLALISIPFSTASAILQAMPLIVILGAAYFFGERVGLKRWVAVLVGFVGVLLIIRPGLESFDAASIFALIATFGFAGRDLATRAAPAVLSNKQLGVYGFFVLIPIGLVMLLYRGDPVQMNALGVAQIVGATVFGVIAYNALTIAMRTGDVSVVSPFRYTRLLFALLVGVFVFGESPDVLTYLGSLLVVLSGGYTLMQSR